MVGSSLPEMVIIGIKVVTDSGESYFASHIRMQFYYYGASVFLKV